MSVPSKAFDGIRYLRITDINENGDLNCEKVSADTEVVDDNYILQEGDLLFARTGATVGKTLLYKNEYGKCSYAGYLIRYRPNQNIVSPKYLFYITRSNRYFKWISENQKTTALPNISAKLYNSYLISYPPLPEQQRIVEYLDTQFAKIDALKANAAQQLQAAKDLFQSALKDLMTPKEGWEEIELIKIFNFIDYRGKTPTKIESGIPLITAKNVKYGYIDYTIRDYISKEEYELRKSRGISRKGDLLFTTEAPLGNVAIADLEEFSAGQRIITLQQYNNSKYSVDNKFYYYYILSPFFQKKIKKLATGATAQGIKAKILKTITVPVLSLSEQQQIADTLDDISNKIKALQLNYEQTITLCSDLKQSLLKQIFE